CDPRGARHPGDWAELHLPWLPLSCPQEAAQSHHRAACRAAASQGGGEGCLEVHPSLRGGKADEAIQSRQEGLDCFGALRRLEMTTNRGRKQMSSETAAIEKTLWTYLDGLHEGDAEKIAQAFHPVSHLYSESNGDVVDVPREKWLDMV